MRRFVYRPLEVAAQVIAVVEPPVVGVEPGSFLVNEDGEDVVYTKEEFARKLTESLNEMRSSLKNAEDTLKAELIITRGMNPEVGANIVLSIRHIEDARMRLGKAIQYSGDGVSIYDKNH